jgi:hypothetical protein
MYFPPERSWSQQSRRDRFANTQEGLVQCQVGDAAAVAVNLEGAFAYADGMLELYVVDSAISIRYQNKVRTRLQCTNAVLRVPCAPIPSDRVRGMRLLVGDRAIQMYVAASRRFGVHNL